MPDLSSFYEVKVDKNESVFVNDMPTTEIKHHILYTSGGFRLVNLTHDGKIIKLDCGGNDSYEIQTESEIKLWNEILSIDKKYFPKIIAHGVYKKSKKKISWLIQEKLNLDENFVPTYEDKSIIISLKNKYDIGDLSLAFYNRNWGRTKRGRLIIWDFGMNKFNRN